MYRIDMHVHTSEVSPCGSIPAAEIVPLYKGRGYDGVIITDHFYDGYFKRQKNLKWPQKIANFLRGYEVAHGMGESCGLDVFAGMEIRFTDSPNDYLVYGVTPEFLCAHPEMYALGLRAFRKIAREAGLLIYQAHPFRPGLTPAEPALLDGIEVYNGNLRHNSRDHLAHDYALKHNLLMSSGSDFHELEDTARGGVLLSRRPLSNADLVAILRSEVIGELIVAGASGLPSAGCRG